MQFLRTPTDDAFLAVNTALKRAVAAQPPFAPSTDLLTALRSTVRATNERIREGHADPACALSLGDLRLIAEWALAVADRESVDALLAPQELVDLKELPSSLHSPWCLAMEQAGALLAGPPLADDLALRAELQGQFERGIRPVAPLFTYFLFTHLPAVFWIRPDSWGREVFRSLVEEGRLRDPGALAGALRVLRFLPPTEQRDILGPLLCSDDAVLEAKTTSQFLEHAGEHMGAHSVATASANPEADAVARLTLTLLSEHQARGLLARSDHFAEWAHSALFGAKEALLHGPSDTKCALRCFAAMADLVTSQLSRLPDDDALAVWVMQPLEVAARAPSHPIGSAVEVWAALGESVVSLIRHGSAAQVFMVVFNLRREGIAASLSPATLFRSLQACAERVAAADLDAPVVGHHGWRDVCQYASEVLGAMGASSEADERLKTWVYETLQHWATRGLPSALENARRVRSRE
jgi:hypothetical protein